MKIFIAKILLWILRKLNISVLINFKVFLGEFSSKSKSCFYYNNNFENTIVRDCHGNAVDISSGTFHIKNSK